MHKARLFIMLTAPSILPRSFEPVPTALVQMNNVESGEEEAIRMIVQQFVAAWNQGDTESLALLFSPDGEFVSLTGSVARGRHEIKRLLAREREEMFKGTTLNKRVKPSNF